MNEIKKKETRGAALLTLTSILWGVAFIFQRTGMDHIGPFAFNFFRCLLSTSFLLLVSGFFRYKNAEHYRTANFKPKLVTKNLLVGGTLAGLALFMGMSLQQVGMMSTTASKAGFITTMYIVLVPLMGVFYGKRPTPKIGLCVLIAAIGLYLISIKQGFVIEKGDFFVFLSAISFSFQIVVVDIFAPRVDAIKLNMTQFITCGILSLIVVLLKETVTVEAVRSAGIALLYTGIASSGIGFTLQVVGQKHLPPTIASLIMSTESIFSLIAGMLVLGESMMARELFGCLVMVVAVVLAQVDLPKRKKANVG